MVLETEMDLPKFILIDEECGDLKIAVDGR